jgi:hypothetical protein
LLSIESNIEPTNKPTTPYICFTAKVASCSSKRP